MEVVYARCAGLDVHKKRILACVRVANESGHIERKVKTFGTTTGDLMVLSDWLRSSAITHVAMESTGIFWKPVYAILEGSFTLLVVNAAHMKAVPGRKTDVRDCEWIVGVTPHTLIYNSLAPSLKVWQFGTMPFVFLTFGFRHAVFCCSNSFIHARCSMYHTETGNI